MLKQDTPGKRFQKRYYRNLKKRGPVRYLRKIFNLIFGILFILTGIVLWFIPGPGWAAILMGIALIAGESLLLARILDFIELRIRKVLKKE